MPAISHPSINKKKSKVKRNIRRGERKRQRDGIKTSDQGEKKNNLPKKKERERVYVDGLGNNNFV